LQAVEDLCIHKLGQGLYSRLEDECQRHIEKSIRNLTGQTPDPVLFLELVHMCWNKHSSQMSLIRSIFLYLVRCPRSFHHFHIKELLIMHTIRFCRIEPTSYRPRMLVRYGILAFLYSVGTWRHALRSACCPCSINHCWLSIITVPDFCAANNHRCMERYEKES
jgi:hypothetical protein